MLFAVVRRMIDRSGRLALANEVRWMQKRENDRSLSILGQIECGQHDEREQKSGY